MNFVERKDLHSHSLSPLLRRRDFQLNACIHPSSPLNKVARIDDFVQFSIGFLWCETDNEVFCADFYVFLESGNVFSDNAFCSSRGLINWLTRSRNSMKRAFSSLENQCSNLIQGPIISFMESRVAVLYSGEAAKLQNSFYASEEENFGPRIRFLQGLVAKLLLTLTN